MKILISDFDISLYNNNFNLDDIIIKINEFRNKGNIFVIATGRNVTSLLKELGTRESFYDYLICGDGTKIFDQNLSEIASDTITDNNRRDIINLLNSVDYIDRVYIDDGYTYYEDNYDISGTEIIAKIIPGKNKEAEELLNKLVTNYKDIGGYVSEHWINITNNYMNKAYAIEKLCQEKSFNKDDIYTFGDEINDYFMVKNYNGYTINNSNDLVAKVSNGNYESIVELISDIEKGNI